MSVEDFFNLFIKDPDEDTIYEVFNLKEEIYNLRLENRMLKYSLYNIEKVMNFAIAKNRPETKIIDVNHDEAENIEYDIVFKRVKFKELIDIK